MLNNQDDLLRLIGKIHVAAADPDRTIWANALRDIGDAVGGSAIMVVDHRLPDTVVELAEARMPPALVGYGLENLGAAPKNGFLREMPAMPVGVPLALDCEEAARTGVDRFLGDEHLLEFLRPTGMQHLLSTILERDAAAGTSLMAGLARGPAHGACGPADVGFFGRVLPHLTAACLVRRRLALALAAAEAPRGALNLLDRGVILVDAAGNMTYSNAAAARILTRHDGLGLDRRGALVAVRPAETGRLGTLIAAAVAAGTGSGLRAGGVLALPRVHGRPYVVQVLPLAPGTELPGVPHLANPPAAALLVADPDVRPAPTQTALRQAYGLTPAEAALTAELVDGLTLRDAAETLGIGENTAKTQLKAVFAKLDVDRQTALVRCVLADLGGLAAPAPTTNGNGARRV